MTQRIFPSLRIVDPGLVDWLASALELEVSERTVDGDGRLVHAQLWLADQCFMVSSTSTLETSPGAASIYLAFTDEGEVRRRYDRAIAAGADVVMVPTPMEYGGINATFRDAEGNHWSLGTYAPRPTPQRAS